MKSFTWVLRRKVSQITNFEEKQLSLQLNIVGNFASESSPTENFSWMDTLANLHYKHIF